MRRLDLNLGQTVIQVRAYEPGHLIIKDTTYTGSLILTPTKIIEDWKVASYEALTPESFTLILSLKPDVLLLGTGAEHHFIAEAIYGELLNQRIGVEVMSTRAACRTFNALVLDGRQVVAALLID